MWTWPNQLMWERLLPDLETADFLMSGKMDAEIEEEGAGEKDA